MPYSVLYVADNDIYKVGPFESEAVADEWVRSEGVKEFEIDEQRVYLMTPDHELLEYSMSDVLGE